MRIVQLRILVVLVLIWSAISFEGQIVPGSLKSESVEAYRASQLTKLHSEQFQIVTQPGGHLMNVALLYSPSTKLFWWSYQAAPAGSGNDNGPTFLKTSITCVSTGEIVNWRWAASPPRLWILRSSEHYGSMAAGRERVLALLKGGELKAWWSQSFREVDLTSALPHDFLYLKGSASPVPGPKLRNVTEMDDKWLIVLDGPNGDSAVVSVNHNYKLIGAKVVPKT